MTAIEPNFFPPAFLCYLNNTFNQTKTQSTNKAALAKKMQGRKLIFKAAPKKKPKPSENLLFFFISIKFFFSCNWSKTLAKLKRKPSSSLHICALKEKKNFENIFIFITKLFFPCSHNFTFDEIVQNTDLSKLFQFEKKKKCDYRYFCCYSFKNIRYDRNSKRNSTENTWKHQRLVC